MLQLIKKTLVIIELEVRKILHDPTEIFTRGVQPVLWILIFGQVFAKLHPLTGSINYMEFMIPGILAQSLLFVSIFYGIAIIWERDLGLTHKFLASPTPRAALVLGKAISAGLRSLPLTAIIYGLAVILSVRIDWNPLHVLGVVTMVVLGAMFFSTFSLIIACLVKTRERFMGIGQILTMPLFFASNAIYPIDIMPAWLQVLSRINPLTYVIDALRSLMIINAPSVTHLALDFGILIGTTTIFISIGAVLYRRVIY
jgi:ABC-2 type transport system permease protein